MCCLLEISEMLKKAQTVFPEVLLGNLGCKRQGAGQPTLQELSHGEEHPALKGVHMLP